MNASNPNARLSTNRRYPIAIEPGTAETVFGVVIPDLPGCFSAGETLEEAIQNAGEAAALSIEMMREERKSILEPSTIKAIRSHPDFVGWIIDTIDIETKQKL